MSTPTGCYADGSAKGTPLCWSKHRFDHAAHVLNTTPRKTLGWRNALDVYDQLTAP
jgi:IS30 family transposase